MSKQGDVIDQLGRVVKLFTHPEKPFVFLFFPIIRLASWNIAKQAFFLYQQKTTKLKRKRTSERAETENLASHATTFSCRGSVPSLF